MRIKGDVMLLCLIRTCNLTVMVTYKLTVKHSTVAWCACAKGITHSTYTSLCVCVCVCVCYEFATLVCVSSGRWVLIDNSHHNRGTFNDREEGKREN